ncbi:hypothetical protein SUGI_0220120 [Cryptomeria japonica]|nr:hypothetical protein SUGI_0220120 [Cryptomeria japonica]
MRMEACSDSHAQIQHLHVFTHCLNQNICAKQSSLPRLPAEEQAKALKRRKRKIEMMEVIRRISRIARHYYIVLSRGEIFRSRRRLGKRRSFSVGALQTPTANVQFLQFESHELVDGARTRDRNIANCVRWQGNLTLI